MKHDQTHHLARWVGGPGGAVFLSLLCCSDLAWAAAPPAAAAAAAQHVREYDAVVVSVHDGDSLVIRKTGETRQWRVRLRGIDAPEKTQPLYEQATALVRERTMGAAASPSAARRVRIRDHGIDRFGRIQADVLGASGGGSGAAGQSVAQEAVRQGFAWAETGRSAASGGEFTALERAARSAKRGVWAGKYDAKREAPWQFRARTDKAAGRVVRDSEDE